jgi:predicted nucleotidyltransferase/DNA-binding transcriptional ArsR family regulator
MTDVPRVLHGDSVASRAGLCGISIYQLVSFPTMRLLDPLDDLLQNKSFVRAIRALEALPQGMEVSIREVARRAKISHPTASTVLEKLLEQGVVLVRRTLWADEYRLNPKHVALQQLHPLLEWERRLPDEVKSFLAQEMQTRATWISAAYLFGSAVRGDMKPGSDLDVAVICSSAKYVAKTEQIMEEVSDLARERYGNRVNAVVGARSLSELSRSSSRGYRLWRRVAKEGAPLLGKSPAR